MALQHEIHTEGKVAERERERERERQRQKEKKEYRKEHKRNMQSHEVRQTFFTYVVTKIIKSGHKSEITKIYVHMLASNLDR